MRRHVLVGAGAAVLLAAFYVGLVAVAQDLEHAAEQGIRLWYWLTPLAVGFGVQGGLFSFIRQAMKARRAAAMASVAASGGVSAGSMVACCAHHLGDVLPLLGMAGVAAFLGSYQAWFLLLGVLSNLVGIAIMLETIQRHGLSLRMAGWKLDMGWLKKGAMALSGIIVVATFFLMR